MYRVEKRQRKPWLKRVIIVVAVLAMALVVATLVIWRFYDANLKPVRVHAQAQSITIESGATPSQIAKQLQDAGLIRSAWAFEAYVRHEDAQQYLQAGMYSLSASQSVQDIVAQLTHGKVSTELVTILPGQRLDQIKQSLINDGFNEAEVTAALEPGQYEGSAALVDKPVGASLEGYLYPDSFQRTSGTKVTTIIQESINEMQKHLTPSIRAAFAKQGLSTYQGIILASVVEQEVSNQSERAQAAQVFLKRIGVGMPLGSDVTAFYGSRAAGQGDSVLYDTPYNTRLHTGFPPTPISNVSESSLQAVAHPANTDWLYFVAGDDGVTHFSKTVQEHESLTQQYCKKLCQ